jgi:hypothetical protein
MQKLTPGSRRSRPKATPSRCAGRSAAFRAMLAVERTVTDPVASAFGGNG